MIVPVTHPLDIPKSHAGSRPGIDYEAALNPQQLAAVRAPAGPALVIAGAGSGKTRTLTYRVAYLLEHGVPPERLLLLTFTNKAAQEMMGRVSRLLGAHPAGLWGGTFHAIGNRILRAHAHLLGFGNDYSILDREDSLDMLKACIKELDPDLKSARFPKPEVMAEIFSRAVNSHRSVTDVIRTEYRYFEQFAGVLAELAELYKRRKRESNAMDFDDLLLMWWRLLQEVPDLREHYQRRFQHVLVDEYQDTNKLQSDIVDVLVAHHHNVMVVGDDAQSIYGWRGANFENILTFPRRYPDARIYKIEANYRSTPEILRVANAAIAANKFQHQKTLRAVRPAGPKPIRVRCLDSFQQAAFVARQVLRLHRDGIPLHQIAVLYRSHFHAMELQLQLTKLQIPFVLTSGIRFFEQAHIKDLTSYLKLVANPNDETAFRRIVLMMPGIGPRIADKLWSAYRNELRGATASAAPAGTGPATNPAGDHPGQPSRSDPVAALRAIHATVPSKTQKQWADLVRLTEQLHHPELISNPAEMINVILESGFDAYLRATYANYNQRRDDIDQLMVFAEQAENLEAFLSQLALLTNLEAEEHPAATTATDALRLSTVHQAKGLEFEAVFLIMLADGLFPNARALDAPAGEEEERRLFYVGITRAKTHLFLCYPEMRPTHGGAGADLLKPSRFLHEIPRQLVTDIDLSTNPAACGELGWD